MFAWGKQGHRIVGEIAQRHLNNKAQKAVIRVLSQENLAMASTWMDFIKSDPDYRYMSPWHYVNVPKGKKYEDVTPSEKGDAIAIMERLIRELKSGKFTDEDEQFALRCLIHLVGDIHQPLHAGYASDLGGNRVRLGWFRSKTNLHRVWDSEIIDYQALSYTEYATWIDTMPADSVAKWQASSVRDWAQESMIYRDVTYDIPRDSTLRYRYNFDHKALLEHRLQQAGIRLAHTLNEIYAKPRKWWLKYFE